jgi:hypothetical protein
VNTTPLWANLHPLSQKRRRSSFIPIALRPLLVLGAYPAHDPAPCEAVDCVEHVLGHGISEVVRPPAQSPVEAGEQLIQAQVAG